MAKFDAQGRLIRRKDKNFFKKMTVSSTNFAQHKVNWSFNSTGLALMVESDKKADRVEYSFDGETVHGDLDPVLPSQAIIFDDRHENTIWFRRASGTTSVVVRIEAWRTEA